MWLGGAPWPSAHRVGPYFPSMGTMGGDGQFWPGVSGWALRAAPVLRQEAMCSVCLRPVTCPVLPALGGATELPFHPWPLELD